MSNPFRQHPRLEKLAVGVGVVVLLAVLGYFYLQPASRAMLHGRTDVLLSNSKGGDHTTLPTMYWVLSEEARAHPTRLLYGTVYTEELNPPSGIGLWVPWAERLIVPLAHSFLPSEAVVTAVVWLLLILNGVAFYWFGRVEGWRRSISLALSIAFAFCVYTRARAAVHAGLVSLYVLPLAFVGLRLVQRATSWRALILPAVLFVACAMAPLYYVIMVSAMVPLLLWFYWRDLPEPRRPLLPLARLAVAVTPSVLFLAGSFLFPVPGEFRGRDTVQRPPVLHNWVYEFSSRPSDYFIGDISLPAPGKKAKDWNPARRDVNQYALENVHPSNPHERSNGIRWILLCPFLALLFAWCVPTLRRRLDPELRRRGGLFAIFAVAAFALSLPPSALHLDTDLGPVRFLHALVPNFRVPARFGVFAHFGVLAFLGWALHVYLDRLAVWERPRLRWLVACALPVLMVLDYPPMQRMPVQKVAATLEPLEQAGPLGQCGTGLFFPFLVSNSSFAEEEELYSSIERLRRTHCRALNSSPPTPVAAGLMKSLGTRSFKKDPATGDRLMTFARCTKLDWIVFRPMVPQEERQRICTALGWQTVTDDACRATDATDDTIDPARC